MERWLDIIKVWCAAMAIWFATPHINAYNAFRSGEQLDYSLYYNWGFVWVKAGTATLTINQSIYEGINALRTRLLMRGNNKTDEYFVLRDTILSIVSADKLQPLYYLKHDIEGKKRKLREVQYSYEGNNCRVKQTYSHANGNITKKDEVRPTQVYDMLSMMLRARNFNTNGWQRGKHINFLMTDGNGVRNHTLIYRGKTKVKMRDSKATYSCLQLSFIEKQEDGEEKEVITFFVTDDENHLPVRLDMYLKFGAAKVYLTGAKGLKNPPAGQIK